MEPFRRTKLFVRVCILAADAEYDGVLLLVQRDVALEVVSFSCAAAGEIFGVKVQNYPLAPQIAKANWFSVLGVQSKIGRERARGGRLFPGARSYHCHEHHEQEHQSEYDEGYFHNGLFLLTKP